MKIHKSLLVLAISLSSLQISGLAQRSSFADNFLRGYQIGQEARLRQLEIQLQQERLELNRQQIRQEQEKIRVTLTNNDVLVAEATKQITSILDDFSQKHPGWNTHELEMVKWSRKLEPKEIELAEYVEVLYFLATKSQTVLIEKTKAEDSPK